MSDPNDMIEFYDAWADDYDAAHADWRMSVVTHGRLLADAFAARDVQPPARILDCTCGIGTQAIGLALAGYSVCGSDISPVEVERARVEAKGFEVSAQFAAADLLDLGATLPADEAWGAFDGVVSANSLTHLADVDTLIEAFAQMASVCRPGGIIAVTNRDYDSLDRPASTAVQLSNARGLSRASFQLWNWADDGRSYRMEDVLLTRPEDDQGSAWTVRSRSTTLYAWQRADIERAAAAAGLDDVQWSQHDWQPIATFRT